MKRITLTIVDDNGNTRRFSLPLEQYSGHEEIPSVEKERCFVHINNGKKFYVDETWDEITKMINGVK